MVPTFATLFVLLHLGHVLGDFLLQTDYMAITKARADRVGLYATLWHGSWLLGAQAGWLVLGGWLLTLELTVTGFLVMLGVNVVTHVLIDWNRRGARLWCYATGSQGFHDRSEPTEGRAEHTHGALHVDQALHYQLTGVAALLGTLL